MTAALCACNLMPCHQGWTSQEHIHLTTDTLKPRYSPAMPSVAYVFLYTLHKPVNWRLWWLSAASLARRVRAQWPPSGVHNDKGAVLETLSCA
eukprot:1161338-Pelagomonas_calceolata.AAC.5